MHAMSILPPFTAQNDRAKIDHKFIGLLQLNLTFLLRLNQSLVLSRSALAKKFFTESERRRLLMGGIPT